MKQESQSSGMAPKINKKVLILETCANGHRGPYLHWMATGLVEHGFNVTIITLPEVMAHPSLRALSERIPDGGGPLQIIEAAAPVKLPSSVAGGGLIGLAYPQLAYWRLFRAWYREFAEIVKPDVVYLPDLDSTLYATGLLGSPFGACPWTGLVMRPSFHYKDIGVVAPEPSLAAIRKAIFFRLLNNRYLRYLLTLDEPLSEYLKGKGTAAEKVVFFPEPAASHKIKDVIVAKEMFGLSKDRKAVIVYGAITARKGVIELLRALACPDFPPSVDVLLAGKISTEIRNALSEDWIQSLVVNGRLRIVDRFISDDEEPFLFAATDVVWLGYKAHYGASGVLVQAARSGCAVLACKEGVIGWQTVRHHLGETASIDDKSSIISALHRIMTPKINCPGAVAAVSIGTTVADAQMLLSKVLNNLAEV